jgi:POT family proton-dependent oligopeptide transporter
MSEATHQLNSSDEFLGHPKGLYVCFFTEMWERFSFYGMKALLFLYLIKYHLFTDEHGYNLLGAYGALVYAMPVIGGLIADRYLGMRKSVIFGASLLVLGHLGMAYEGYQASMLNGEVTRDNSALQVFYFSLALIIMGVGFLKPNISTIVGKLYQENDPRRDSGFTVFYAGINLGAWIAPLICGYLGETYGWKYGFGLAGIGMLGGLLVFIFGQKYLKGHGEPNSPQKLKEKRLGLTTEKWIYLISFAGVFLVWALIQTHSLLVEFLAWLPAVSPVIWFMHSISLTMTIGIVWYLVKYCNSIQRQQMFVLLMFIFAGLLFFGLYEQTYSSWMAFSDRVMDRNMFGIEWQTSQLVSLGAFFIILLTPFFAWLWPALARKNLNPSKPMKMAYGLMFAGLSFLVLVWATNSPGESGLISVWFLVLAYFVLELGELCLSPISLSAVTQLSVKRIVSLMMGAWFLGTAYSEVVAVELAKLSSMETHGGKIADVGEAITKYQDLFILSAKIGFVGAAAYFILTPILKKMMHGVD